MLTQVCADFQRGQAVPDVFYAAFHWFPILTKLVSGCLFPWLPSVNVKGCPRKIVASLPQKLWCNWWLIVTESVILLVCLSFQLHVTVCLPLLPYFWTTQLAYLLISALVCMRSNVCARVSVPLLSHLYLPSSIYHCGRKLSQGVALNQNINTSL